MVVEIVIQSRTARGEIKHIPKSLSHIVTGEFDCDHTHTHKQNNKVQHCSCGPGCHNSIVHPWSVIPICHSMHHLPEATITTHVRITYL